MLESCFRRIGPVVTLELYSGKNVTSLNYRVETKAGQFALKRRPVASAATTFSCEVAQQRYFASCGMPTPEILLTEAGEPIVRFGAYAWVLSRYVSGYYFTGETTELESAASALARFTAAAAGTSQDDLGFWVHEKTDFLHELPDLVSRASKELGDSVLRILSDLELVKKFARSTPKLVPMHLDYHPLNILVSGGSVIAVIDFEHFKVVPVPVGAGFACYKLVRQHIVHVGGRSPSAAQRDSWLVRWLAAWNSGAPEQLRLDDPVQLGMGAKYRVLFLIHKILAEMLRAGENRFAYDLGKQLRSLSEIAMLFPDQDGKYLKGSADDALS